MQLPGPVDSRSLQPLINHSNHLSAMNQLALLKSFSENEIPSLISKLGKGTQESWINTTCFVAQLDMYEQVWQSVAVTLNFILSPHNNWPFLFCPNNAIGSTNTVVLLLVVAFVLITRLDLNWISSTGES